MTARRSKHPAKRAKKKPVKPIPARYHAASHAMVAAAQAELIRALLTAMSRKAVGAVLAKALAQVKRET